MPFRDLQNFLVHLERHGHLRRVRVEVDPEFEITEIATRVVREEGPALLFERVKGSSYPLAINFLGSRKRIEMVLGMEPQALGEKLATLLETLQPPSLKSIWRTRPFWSRLLATRPRRVRRGVCQEVVESPDLGKLPILKCWPEDGGRFITFPLVMTRDPVTGASNLGIYRLHVFDKSRTGMHMQIQKGGGFHYFQAEKRGQDLEVACVLGADPALMLSGIFPLPEGFEEIMFSGILRGRRTILTRAKTLQLEVPAAAEFVLEGVVRPREREMEGPFGDHFGHYSDAAPFPIFRIQTITRKRKPVYPAAVVGKPPQEDRYMGDAAQEILMPFIKMMRPEIRDMWAYYEAGFHNLLVVAVEGRYTKEPVKTALGLMGEGQLGLTKCIVLVEPSVDVRNFAQVLRAIQAHFVPQDDFVLVSRAPLDTLDFTSFKMHLGSKMVIDATGQAAGPIPEHPVRKDPARLTRGIRAWRLLEDTLLVVQVEGDVRELSETAKPGRGPLTTLVAAPEEAWDALAAAKRPRDEAKTPKGILSSLVGAPELGAVKIIAAVSPDVRLDDDVELLWGIFTRFDPARDVIFKRTELHGVMPIYEGVMGIDATFKKGYPRPLEMVEDIKARVNRRWQEYWSQA